MLREAENPKLTTVPQQAEDSVNVLVYATPMWHKMHGQAEYMEVSPVDLLNAYAQFTKEMVTLTPDQEFVLQTSDGHEVYPHIMDQRFKPRLEWQIGEANREFSINVPAEDRDLMMEICNEMGVTLEELYARGIKMGQFISEGLRNKTIEAVLVYNKDSSEIYTVPVPNPIYRLKDFGR